MDIPNNIRGKPKSGRIWKTQKKKFSSMNQCRPLKSSWESKVKMRNDRKALILHVNEMKKIKDEEIQMKKQRRKEKIERKKLNERKSEIVQVIRDSAKIKRMSKKKLRRIEKRDITVVEK